MEYVIKILKEEKQRLIKQRQMFRLALTKNSLNSRNKIDDEISQIERALAELSSVPQANELLPHVSPRYYYVATKVNKNEIRLISGGFSKKDAIEYKQFIIQKYPTAFIIADFNEG